MKKLLFVLLLSIISLPSITYGACNLTKVKHHNDRHIYPTQSDYDNYMAYVCGKGYCEDGTVLVVNRADESAYVGGSWLSKKQEYEAGFWSAFKCKRGLDDKWIRYNSSFLEKCGSSRPRDPVGWGNLGFAWGSQQKDAKNIYKDVCYKEYEEIEGIKCTSDIDGELYTFSDKDGFLYSRGCENGIWYDTGGCPAIVFCEKKPTGWKKYSCGEDMGVYIKENLPASDYDYCMVCEDGYKLVNDDCIPESSEQTQQTTTKPNTTTQQKTSQQQPAATKKTVEEQCREYNGGVDCSAERLACFKKGSATTWENGKCKCKDKNREWKNGQCIAKTNSTNTNKTCTLEFKSGEIVNDIIGASMYDNFPTVLMNSDYGMFNPRDDMQLTDLVKVNGEHVSVKKPDWGKVERLVFNCDKWKNGEYFAYECKCNKWENDEEGTNCEEGYFWGEKLEDNDVNAWSIYTDCIKSENKVEQQPEQKPDATQVEIKNAEKVLTEFFAYADNDKNKNVWKDKDGNFNTARLASDLTAGVVLGTVGGVVSGVVIKKKQVEKGFNALHCTVGGQTVADWGDTFRIGIQK